VYISLPNQLHAEWTIKALEAGIHVLCEKPFAVTLEDVDSMIAASQRSGCVLAEAFMYRHHPQTKLLDERIQRGDLGDLLAIRGVFNFLIRGGWNIRLAPELGGGSLWDVGTYPVSLAQYIFQSAPDWVSASQRLGPTGVDLTFTGLLHYPGDRTAQIMSSFETPYYAWADIVGTQGRMVLDQPFTGQDENTVLRFYPKDGEMQEIPVPDQYLYLGEVEDMHSAVLDGQPPYLRLSETRDHIRTILALYEAARTHRIVHLE
ncbi:MAG TPA: Gfo/Idh/MocA family oxidoreductase, partial [Anaerolineales bacterium]|nr:Gfo/Idh/MocA family oxidoreductase [Anaerolineales bacterium]